MINRPNLQDRVKADHSARYHGPEPTGPILGALVHETDSERWYGSGGTEEYLNSGAKKASYTYVILDDGTIVRHVPKGHIAYHAGVWCIKEFGLPGKEWIRGQGRSGSVNGRTIGISWVNRIARNYPLSEKQLESGLWLCSVMMEKHGFGALQVRGHREVCPTWKSDPMTEHLDLDHFRKMLGGPIWPEKITAFPEDLCER